MAPPTATHSRITAKVAQLIEAKIEPPCAAYVSAGIVLPHKPDCYYLADVAVSCTELTRSMRAVPDPQVVFEILSPPTVGVDVFEKVPDYRATPSVQEIVLVSAVTLSVELQRRTDTGWVVDGYKSPDDRIRLRSLDVELRLGDLYTGVDLD